MIRNQDVLSSLPLLASILGDQYGIEVKIGGDEAKTDGKTIYLPSLPLNCDRDLLALVRGFLDHEAAHIRHTDFPSIMAAKMDAVTFNLFNAIEDWRIEQKLARIFPGCRQNLNWLIRRLLLENKTEKHVRAGARSPALTALEYVLLTARSWDVPELSVRITSTGQILDRHFPGLRARLDTILENVQRHCPDSHTAIDYARQLAACLKHWQPPAGNGEEKQTADTRGRERKQPNQGKNGSGSEARSPHEASGQSEVENDASSTCASEEQATEGGGRGNAASPENAQAELSSLFSMDAAQLPAGTGEIVRACLQDNACKNREKGICVAVRGQLRVQSLNERDRQEALQASIALRTRFCSLLQTQTRCHCQTARRGRLNTTAIHRLSIGGTKIFRKEAVQSGIDTAIHILLDASGSMSGEPIRLASLACYAVAKALEHARRISVGITAFPSRSHIGEASVCPLLEHGQPLTDRFQVDSAFDTPLAEALWWTMQVLARRQERRKILLILTDGQPNTWKPTCEALRQIMASGTEVYGIGLNDCNIGVLLPEKSRIIRSLKELAPVMFDFLQHAIIRRNDG